MGNQWWMDLDGLSDVRSCIDDVNFVGEDINRINNKTLFFLEPIKEISLKIDVHRIK